MKNNQKGFSPLAALLILVIIGLIGLTGWYVWQQKAHTRESSNPAITPKVETPNTTKANTNQYAGWKTYNSAAEGFQFKYPADWKLTDTLNPRDISTKEAVSLAGPNDFLLKFDVYKINQNSNFGCQGCEFNEASPLQIKNFGNKPLYLIVESRETNGQPFQVLSIAEYKSRQQQPIQSWPYYTSKILNGYVIRWSGEYVKPGVAGGEPVPQTYNNFVKMPEVSTAKKILNSLAY